jgi:aminoglycoside phosphotransferase (APT) family kinase protein
VSLALVEELFPQLEARSVVAIDEGWDSLVLEVDGEWIVRVPRRPEVCAAVEVEVRLLPELAPMLPAPVPRFEHVTEKGVAYRKLRGSPLDAARPALGREVGRFLAALHAFPVERARELGVPSRELDWRERYRAFTEEVLARGGALLGDDRAGAEAMAETYLATEANFAFQPRLVHADLGPAHVLAAGDELTGVIDWSDARIGDAALDFAWLLHGTTAEFAEAVLAGYGSDDPALVDRALFFHRLGPWYELHYGLYFDKPAFVESGLAGVRSRLPGRVP